MKTDTCKQLLHNYLKSNPGWHSKGSLYVVMENEGYSPETGARKLRLLAEEGNISVEYYHGKRNQKLAKYMYKEKPLVQRPMIVEVDGQLVAKFN